MPELPTVRKTMKLALRAVLFLVLAGCARHQPLQSGACPDWKTSDYALPFPVGKSYWVSQANFYGGQQTLEDAQASWCKSRRTTAPLSLSSVGISVGGRQYVRVGRAAPLTVSCETRATFATQIPVRPLEVARPLPQQQER